MSSYIYTYQHSCKKGTEAYILHNSAFKSNIVKKSNGNKYLPFLGEGYYYWEENDKAAHSWGKRKYGDNNYNIVEYINANILRDDLLDFLNRRDLKYFNELIEKYKEKRNNSINWQIVNWIEFFKKLEETNKGIFPFKFLRADENLPNPSQNNKIKDKSNFNNTGYYTFLNPLIMLCTINKCNLNCEKKHIIY